MARFASEIARAVVLSIFSPLVISSGGNAGSQASTLVIRAMALGELRLRDWWRDHREISGLSLGLILGAIGLPGSPWAIGSYGEHWALLGLAVSP
jgi:magnesium transporter